MEVEMPWVPVVVRWVPVVQGMLGGCRCGTTQGWGMQMWYDPGMGAGGADMKKDRTGASFPLHPGESCLREGCESRHAVLADISRGSALPTGLWAKGFAGEM